MKEFKTSKGEFLAVKVPENSSDFYVFNDNYNPYIFYKIKHETGRIRLDDAKYSIIGLLSEITEEQAKDVVHLQTARFNLFKNYTGHDGMFRTALESFNSLMQANEIYSENPHQKSHFNPEEFIQEEYERFIEAQENTGNWLILKRL